MAKTVKVGNLYVEVPDNSPLLERKPVVFAEKPSEKIDPDPIAEVRVYQPNDPFQSSIDRIEMLGNIEKVDKPWVRKTFVFFFLVFPLTCGGLGAIAALINEPNPSAAWKLFFFINFVTVLLCTPYFFMWRRASRRKAKRAASEA